MPSPILHRGASVACFHPPGKATPKSSFARVLVSGQEVVTLSPLDKDHYTIRNCPLNSPCASGTWTSGATKVTAGGEAVAIFNGSSTCVPTGNPMVPKSAQTRVRAT